MQRHGRVIWVCGQIHDRQRWSSDVVWLLNGYWHFFRRPGGR